ncbi:flagellar L-ring protein [Nitrospira sp.]|nr:flagellar L-ring protein [Nitrospira sp.]
MTQRERCNAGSVVWPGPQSVACWGLCVALVTACGTTKSPVSANKVSPTPLPPPQTAGSLWQEDNGRAYLYEDLRAMRVGDIVVVQIVENHKGSKSADTSAERESTIDNSLGGSGRGFLGIPGISLSPSARQGLGIDAQTKNKFGGKGATSRADTLTGTLAAVVAQVLPNGDLRIEGHREVTVNSEKQLMTLSGVVRRVDVDTKNQILSSAIADAKIEYSGLGVVDDVQRPGWFTRILDWIYPF